MMEVLVATVLVSGLLLAVGAVVSGVAESVVGAVNTHVNPFY